MKMSRFEKAFVNRPGKGLKNAQMVAERMDTLDAGAINDVLEIGCGIGTASAWIAEHYGVNVVGTDVDPGQIAEARRRYGQIPNLRFSVEDAASLSFPDGSFDLVVVHNTFHHIPNWETAVQELRRVMRPGGRVLWLDIVFAEPLRRLLDRAAPGESFFRLEAVTDSFARAGFAVEFHQPKQHLLFVQHNMQLALANPGN